MAYCSMYEPFHEKTNIVDSALSIDPDQPKHAVQSNPGRHFLPFCWFLFQESLLYTCTSIPLRRNVSARISLRELSRLNWVDTLRRYHNVCFLVELLICMSRMKQQCRLDGSPPFIYVTEFRKNIQGTNTTWKMEQTAFRVWKVKPIGP